ncbi:MAG TPA: glycosyltransferase family 2 protein [Candidatus Bathyarchaeia archaeon]|nr:glycosyltransferase family 2 protein [Candidatus Bathyarchaeia archaeon]
MSTAASAAAPSVVAVVVNYNGGAVTRACVESLRASEGIVPRVVVVDNASAPGEQAALRSAHAESADVELIFLPENRHFAGGVNAGAARGLALDAGYLLFLNNDTVLAPDCIRLLVEAAEQDPGAGLVGPALLDLRDPQRVLSLGERYSLWSICVPRSLVKVRSPGAGSPYPVGGIMGSVIMVSAPCFRRVGSYREDLRVYYEEVDYCLRARALGYHPIIVPRAIARHDGLRGFTAGLQAYAAHLKARNMLILLRDYGRPLDWLGFLPTYAALVLASAAIYALRGDFAVVRALFRGVADGMRALGEPAVRPAP